MMNIIMWPDERLTLSCDDITTFDDWVLQMEMDLRVTMLVNNGVGLAAPQVGVLANMFVANLSGKMITFINPNILTRSKKVFAYEEGCLSVPGYFDKRKRPANIEVKYQDAHGQHHHVNLCGLDAFIVQHEYDHLQGKVFVDNNSARSQTFIKRQVIPIAQFFTKT